MKVSEQGAGRDRHLAIPRTLVFLTRLRARGEREVLLIKGAPTKRLWANRYNGIGGHVEPNEDVRRAAARELREESGIEGVALTLRGVVSIDTRTHADPSSPGILVFVFMGEAGDDRLLSTAEGAPEWLPIATLAGQPVVDDVPELLARALDDGPVFYAHYTPLPDGAMRMDFS